MLLAKKHKEENRVLVAYPIPNQTNKIEIAVFYSNVLEIIAIFTKKKTHNRSIAAKVT